MECVFNIHRCLFNLISILILKFKNNNNCTENYVNQPDNIIWNQSDWILDIFFTEISVVMYLIKKKTDHKKHEFLRLTFFRLFDHVSKLSKLLNTHFTIIQKYMQMHIHSWIIAKYPIHEHKFM